MRIKSKLFNKLARAFVRWYVRNWYEAADRNPQRPRRLDKRTADKQVKASQAYLQDTARNLDNNSDISVSVLNELQRKIWGPRGLQPEFQVKLKNGQPAKEVNERFAQLWELWAEDPFVDGEDNYASGQNLMGLSWLRDGEVFTRIHAGNVEGLEPHVPEIPLWLEMIESQDCPIDYTDEAKNIQQGVKKNRWSRPVTFYFKKPGKDDLYISSWNWNEKDLVSVPASNICHVKHRRRIRQTRGVTYLASVLNTITDLSEVFETERISSRVAAAVVMQILKGTADEYSPSDKTDEREFEVSPGTVYNHLFPGEKAEILESKRPNPDLANFRSWSYKGISGGTGTTYSSVARDFGDLSYSSARQERTDGQDTYRFLSGFWIGRQERKITRFFTRFAWATLPVRLQNAVDLSTLYKVSYTMPGLPYLNPLQEAQADLMLLSGGENGIPLTSWEKIVRRRGDNPREVFEQILAEKALLEQIRQIGMATPTADNEVPENASQDEAQQTQTTNKVRRLRSV